MGITVLQEDDFDSLLVEPSLFGRFLESFERSFLSDDVVVVRVLKASGQRTCEQSSPTNPRWE